MFNYYSEIYIVRLIKFTGLSSENYYIDIEEIVTILNCSFYYPGIYKWALIALNIFKASVCASKFLNKSVEKKID